MPLALEQEDHVTTSSQEGWGQTCLNVFRFLAPRQSHLREALDELIDDAVAFTCWIAVLAPLDAMFEPPSGDESWTSAALRSAPVRLHLMSVPYVVSSWTYFLAVSHVQALTISTIPPFNLTLLPLALLGTAGAALFQVMLISWKKHFGRKLNVEHEELLWSSVAMNFMFANLPFLIAEMRHFRASCSLMLVLEFSLMALAAGRAQMILDQVGGVVTREAVRIGPSEDGSGARRLEDVCEKVFQAGPASVPIAATAGMRVCTVFSSAGAFAAIFGHLG